MLSNPPFGVDWKKIEGEIKDEHTLKGFDGRFGAGLPRVSDGSLLFLMHLISKMRDASDNGGRIGIILNGSPLFTGGAGSGESEIRRYILEADLLEGIIALPTDMFYNTGIATYMWVLSNKKTSDRKGKVQLIDGSNLCGKMRKSLGSKRNLMSEDDIKLITRTFGNFEVIDATSLADLGLNKPAEQKSNRGRTSFATKGSTSKKTAPKTFASKIFNSTDFGYRRLTIERPLRLSSQITDTAIESLRFAPKPFNAPMERLYNEFGTAWNETDYGYLAEVETEVRKIIKAEFSELKEKQIKDLLDSKLWLFQRSLMDKALQLQTAVAAMSVEKEMAGGRNVVSNDFNQFDITMKGAFKATSIKFDTKEKKQFFDAVTFKNPDAEPVIKKVIKEAAQPLYGSFNYNGKVVEFQPDGDLRDNENVPLDSSVTTTESIENYVKREVLPHVSDAWINADKRDEKDNEIGIVGYEIPFNRHFYMYQPPRALEAIDEDLALVSDEIMRLLQEVRS
ncbi:N-6 DNA methylase [Photobacterium carnosum]|nr:N-6 DNA methylase [Photobacterium carnosum]MCF2215312.1 N-6 DNA methylase [Photobacterium carnosum]